jgi:UDP-galactopyranose mutase
MKDLINNSDIIVVGSGIFGLTVAERLTAELGLKVLILERRSSIGGNMESYFDEETGIEVHKYGSHLFHTNNAKVWEYVKTFSEFTNYRHKVLATHNGQFFSLPINLHTICQFYGGLLSPNEARELIESKRSELDASSQNNLEDKAISLIGPDLYHAFIKNYTKKQWQTHPKQLPSDIITRLPVRFNFNSDYFDDIYQGLPMDGYSALLSRMVEKLILPVQTNVDYFAIRHLIPKGKILVYTGPLDQFFNYQFGKLSWRTLDFEEERFSVQDFQGCSVMNYSDDDVPFTRIHEFKHLHPERKQIFKSRKTIVMREFSRFCVANDEPYYPINSVYDRSKLLEYRKLASLERNTFFGGRLGSYQYLDMHMAIASAFALLDNELFPRFR